METADRTYTTRRDCNNCFSSTEYQIPFGCAFESYHRTDNVESGYLDSSGTKIVLRCRNCGLARLV